MGLLTRDQILKAQDRSFKDVPVPEWSGKVRIQSLTGKERDEWEESNLGAKKKDGSRDVLLSNMRARLVAKSAVDKDGKPLFSDADVMVLGEKNSFALNRLCDVAKKLSGIGEAEEEEILKNSGTGQGAGSPSGSPSTSVA